MSKMQLVKKTIEQPDIPGAIDAEDALPPYAPQSLDDMDRHCYFTWERANISDRLLIAELQESIAKREAAMTKFVNQWMPQLANLFDKDGNQKASTRHTGRYCGNFTYKPDRAPKFKITDKDAAVAGGLAEVITKTSEITVLTDAAKAFGMAELAKYGITVEQPDEVSFSPKKTSPASTET